MKSSELEQATLKSLIESYNIDKIVEETMNDISYHLENDRNNDVWIVGTIKIGKKKYKVNAKVYLEGSEFGIDNGPISKLYIRDIDNRETIVNYDRGWDIKPTEQNHDVYVIITEIVKKFREENPYIPDNEKVEST